ncbi:two-component system sensor histidine kinase PmrB [Gilliamella sp. Pra-s65]|uniref:two-component system sensor histidine kinase PmrB n=2 Tax=unclassified Gilliamella TaxID=2685620 RepID=UPI001328D418|nr:MULTISPECIES: two-component system sensor histidine kinase PmrB [unclassified Gilliamella]MWN31211.1 two-component system sensor histidine kinase PmrB [Gilliamella sp. Pra-s60]MWN89971.1 two-component system sensor histidine kinase PmrB [Gilliamella sp. Pra-s65]MWP29736.1 two-component system sensor histidine kinase PmrB [Gilliamella sp. Pra-s54]MWP72902.1 two-component system sensor histidine kinase PmrB [Gilliamella sp. Pra-s52]
MISKSLNNIRHSIRWNLFFTLGFIMLVCQIITVFWLWHESKEQIDALVNLTLSQNKIDEVVEQEELEAIFVLFCSAFSMMLVTLFLAYQAIKRITKPLEILEKDLNQRTEQNLNPIAPISDMREIKSITSVLNNLFVRLNNTLSQERLFTADVAHEMRTPLAGIRLHLELLENKHNIDCCELISRIDRLVNTVEQLLMLARASQKFTIGQYQHINFYNDIMIPLSDELTELTSKKQQRLEWYMVNKNLVFNGDVTLIRLLVRNLVENSYRYSPDNTKIMVSCYQDKKDIVITVEDDGKGIDESKSEQLTQAFFRMDRKHNGIGLGLSIVNRIAKLHHGLFTLKNRPDKANGVIAQFRIIDSDRQLNV